MGLKNIRLCPTHGTDFYFRRSWTLPLVISIGTGIFQVATGATGASVYPTLQLLQADLAALRHPFPADCFPDLDGYVGNSVFLLRRLCHCYAQLPRERMEWANCVPIDNSGPNGEPASGFTVSESYFCEDLVAVPLHPVCTALDENLCQ